MEADVPTGPLSLYPVELELEREEQLARITARLAWLLDAFEGREYQRILLPVELPDGRRVNANIYVVAGDVHYTRGVTQR